jgi:ribosomal protein S18 acetylase RimI-like enzyme
MPTENIIIRRAERRDVPAIVALLADDPLGAKREHARTPLPSSYYDAFDAIASDPNHELVVMETDGDVAGTLQLTILPHLTYRGGRRGHIEAVRVHTAQRGAGLGRRLIQWAVDRARERGCHVVQLTTDASRPDAVAFYETLGFRSTHVGMKLHF